MNSIYQEELYKLYDKMAEAYYYHVLPLKMIDNPIIKNGLGEGLNKFLSNAYIGSFQLFDEYKGCSQQKRWLTTHYFTEEALVKIKKGNYTGLRFEHIIPKNIYQNALSARIQDNDLTLDYVKYIIKECWLLATVTEEEHKALHKNEDKDLSLDDYIKDKFIRYKNIGLYNEKEENKLKENYLLGTKVKIII